MSRLDVPEERVKQLLLHLRAAGDVAIVGVFGVETLKLIKQLESKL